jgi:hypothetical protein
LTLVAGSLQKFPSMRFDAALIGAGASRQYDAK